jgi:hypothetical protein
MAPGLVHDGAKHRRYLGRLMASPRRRWQQGSCVWPILMLIRVKWIVGLFVLELEKSCSRPPGGMDERCWLSFFSAGLDAWFGIAGSWAPALLENPG